MAAGFWVQKAPQGPHVLSLAPSSGLWRQWPHTWPLSRAPEAQALTSPLCTCWASGRSCASLTEMKLYLNVRGKV